MIRAGRSPRPADAAPVGRDVVPELLRRLDQIVLTADVLGVVIVVAAAMGERRLVVDYGRERDTADFETTLTETVGAAQATSALHLTSAAA